jgi:hypothetical protein
LSPHTPPAGPPDLPHEAEALYRAPLAEFVDARNALAARLRKAGDAEASARVKALPKPGAAAWALNQVYWRSRDDYTRMIAAGDRLRSLQQQMLAGRSADPRDATQERQGAVRKVVERALAFLAEAGQPATDATRQRVNVTADALATWGSHPQDYVPGFLDRELEPPGFDAIASLGATALRLVKPSAGRPSAGTEVPALQTTVPALHEKGEAPQQKGGPTPPASSAAAKRAATKAEQEAARAREAERKRLARALQEVERGAAARRSADERARGVLTRATADVEAARKELGALERQLVTVRARVDRAERTRADAQASADAVRRAHEEAEDAVARVRRELDEL